MCNEANCQHDHLDDDISDIFGGDVFNPATKYLNEDGTADMSISANVKVRMHEEKCTACRNGRFISWGGRDIGPCRKCKGTGIRYFRQSLNQREAAKARRDSKKAQAAADIRAAADQWMQEHPSEYQWLRSSAGYSEVATSLLGAVNKFGHLTEKQLAAVQNILAKNAARDAARQETIAQAPTLNVEPLYQAFQTAISNGLKRPKMYLETFKFSLAPASGNNAGCLYVVNTDGDVYLGKITPEHKFVRVRANCSDEMEAQVINVCANPLENAVAYGKRTGVCSCCGRELTNEDSIERGIGPICAGKYGW